MRPLPPHDLGGVHAGAPQLADGGVGHRMRGEARSHRTPAAPKPASATATLASPPPKVADELGSLEEALEARRREPQHDFAEGDGFSQHGRMAMLARSRGVRQGRIAPERCHYPRAGGTPEARWRGAGPRPREAVKNRLGRGRPPSTRRRGALSGSCPGRISPHGIQL